MCSEPHDSERTFRGSTMWPNAGTGVDVADTAAMHIQPDSGTFAIFPLVAIIFNNTNFL